MRKSNLLKCYTTGVKGRKQNKTKQNKTKTVAGSNQYILNEKPSFSGKQKAFL